MSDTPKTPLVGAYQWAFFQETCVAWRAQQKEQARIADRLLNVGIFGAAALLSSTAGIVYGKRYLVAVPIMAAIVALLWWRTRNQLKTEQRKTGRIYQRTCDAADAYLKTVDPSRCLRRSERGPDPYQSKLYATLYEPTQDDDGGIPTERICEVRLAGSPPKPQLNIEHPLDVQELEQLTSKAMRVLRPLFYQPPEPTAAAA